MTSIGLEKFDSLISLVTYFKDNDTCKDFLVNQRWSDGDYICPYCGQHHCYRRNDGKFRCPNCLKNFSVLVGTVFENTKISLVKWFMAMYLISSHKKGISSHQLSRDIDVTQKSAWYILHKVRTLFSQENVELSEDVECDEAYIGGQEKYKHASKKTEGTQGRSLKTKTPVFGMAQRDGNIIAKKTDNVQGKTLFGIINQFVKSGSRIFTDEYIGYNTIVESEYTHSVVNHGAKQFVDGDSHTNTIEGFWSQLKRAIFGIYHFVSAKYLQRYVDEAVFRYNTCKKNESDRFKAMFLKSIGLVRYDDVLNMA